MSRAAVRFLAAAAAVVACAAASAAPAIAGGLVWNLPDPGKEARYEGAVTQTLTGRDNQQTEIARLRRVTVRSLEPATGTFRGEDVPARWLEFVTETGTPGERGLDPGPVGRVIYKILVPEAAVTGELEDDAGIPYAFLPVLKGWRQAGDGEPTELGPAFRAYPTVCLLTEFEPDEIRVDRTGLRRRARRPVRGHAVPGEAGSGEPRRPRDARSELAGLGRRAVRAGRVGGDGDPRGEGRPR